MFSYSRLKRFLPVEERFVVTAVARFPDGSTGEERGLFSVFVGDGCVFSAKGTRVLDGPVELEVEPDMDGKVLEVNCED